MLEEKNKRDGLLLKFLDNSWILSTLATDVLRKIVINKDCEVSEGLIKELKKVSCKLYKISKDL